MPIVYSAEKQGWFLENPTPEEVEQITAIGTQEFVSRFSSMVMERAIQEANKEEASTTGEVIPAGVKLQ